MMSKKITLHPDLQESEDHSSFYHLWHHSWGDHTHPLTCKGTACFTGRYRNPGLYEKAVLQTPPVYCLGKCYASPADELCELRPALKVVSSKAIILEGLVNGPARTLEQYTSRGGYEALKKSLTAETGEEIIRTIENSHLRGRGGAGFPTGKKWRALYEVAQGEGDKVIIANADEGDPGAYIDRFIMEDDPFRLIEAMTIAGYATGANIGIIYIRHEYPEAHDILLAAIHEARKSNLLGSKILGSHFSFELSLFRGQGSYICGEETALVNSLEEKRPEPRPRPPYLTESGLWGKPTLVNNIETFAAIPWIVLNGAEAYRALGFSKSRGTKVISLNSLFKKPGLYEVEFGISVKDIIDDLGGGLSGTNLAGVIIGGPLAGILPPGLLDTPFGFEELRTVGASVGHGGIVAFDEHTSIAELIHHVFSFGAFESCGKCTPCRLGSRRIENIFAEIIKESKNDSVENKSENEALKNEFLMIVKSLRLASFCGLGTGLADFANSIQKHYSKELERCFK